MKRLWLLLLLLPGVALAEGPDDSANRALDYFTQGQTDAMVDFMFRQGTLGEAEQAPVTADVLKLKMELQTYREKGEYCFREKVLEQEISGRLVRQVWVVGFVGDYVRVEFMLYRPAHRWAFTTFTFADGDSASAQLLEDFRQTGYRQLDATGLPAPQVETQARTCGQPD